MKGEERMTEAQKKAVEVQKEIEEACIRHGLNLTIFENGIGFVDPKENKIVMVWRPQYKPETLRNCFLCNRVKINHVGKLIFKCRTRCTL